MIGRLLRSTTTEFLVGCRLEDVQHLPFGALVKMPWWGALDRSGMVYGLVAWMHIPEGSMARQVAVQPITPGILQDQRATVEPVEVRVLVVGYESQGEISHLLPPHPPEPMAAMHLCEEDEVVAFTSAGRLGYLRHVLQAGGDIPVPELLAAHLRHARLAHEARGQRDWVHRAVQRVIHLLRDDPPRLFWTLDALSDALPQSFTLEEAVP